MAGRTASRGVVPARGGKGRGLKVTARVRNPSRAEAGRTEGLSWEDVESMGRQILGAADKVEQDVEVLHEGLKRIESQLERMDESRDGLGGGDPQAHRP